MTSTLDKEKLDNLLSKAKETRSDALLLLHNNTIIEEWYSDEDIVPIELMSSLKSIVSLLFGIMLTKELITSLDQHVSTFYPEWKQGKKTEITIRHLLNHTSGLQNVPNAGQEIYPAPDVIQLALTAELDNSPGSTFAYNNKAVNLLAGIIEVATGTKMDKFCEQELFTPLEINHGKWYYDPAGNPHAMAGLSLLAIDFAKIGQLVLNKGKWDDQQLISGEFIETMLDQGQPYYPGCGLLWWRKAKEERFYLTETYIDNLEQKGLDASIILKLAENIDKEFSDRSSYHAFLSDTFGDDWLHDLRAKFVAIGASGIFCHEITEISGYFTEGYLGQYLVIVPEKNIVAVRQIKRREDHVMEHNFRDFVNLIMSL